MIGLDDATLTGAPRKMLMGSWEALRAPDSIVVDKAGYILLFPDQPIELGRTLEMNDHRVTIVGIVSVLVALAYALIKIITGRVTTPLPTVADATGALEEP